MSRLALNNLNISRLMLSRYYFKAIIKNISLNAINCAIVGEVSISISRNQITIVDNGVGLDAKPRGDEGFGIGLNLVRDICQKYNWKISLTNNKEMRCTATISFNKHKKTKLEQPQTSKKPTLKIQQHK